MAITKNVKQTPSGSLAVHASTDDGAHQLVGIGNLRVLLVPDYQFWYAQALEIDYGAQGDTIVEAKKNFEDGLASTIDLNLRIHDNIDSLLTPAPSDVLIEAAHNRTSIEHYSQISIHEIGAQAQAALPFSGIEYLKVQEAAA